MYRAFYYLVIIHNSMQFNDINVLHSWFLTLADIFSCNKEVSYSYNNSFNKISSLAVCFTWKNFYFATLLKTNFYSLVKNYHIFRAKQKSVR